MAIEERSTPSSAVILMVAGEASGDLHAANLARQILERLPAAQLFGIGGSRMQEAGVRLLRRIDDLAVVGIGEVMLHWRAIRQTFRSLCQFIQTKRPDLLILIDYPDFNLRLAKVARREHIKVLYYISPQVWAWRRWRIKTIARTVDTLLVIFPFELPLYQGCGLDVRFIGHPLMDVIGGEIAPGRGAEPREIEPSMGMESINPYPLALAPGRWAEPKEPQSAESPQSDSLRQPAESPSMREEICRRLGVDPKRPIIALLPGSRKSEISRILPQLLGAAEKLIRQKPDLQFLLALASTIKPSVVEPYLRRYPSVTIHCRESCTYDILRVADLALVSSGTATLETALLNTPMILVYRLSLLSYILGRMLIRVPYIGLVNLVAEKKIVPELIQYQANADKIASLAMEILQDQKRREYMRRELRKIRDRLGEPGSAARAAEVVVEMLGR